MLTAKMYTIVIIIIKKIIFFYDSVLLSDINILQEGNIDLNNVRGIRYD